MKNSLLKDLQTIRAMIELEERKLEDYKPYVYLKCISFINDEYEAEYYKQGKHSNKISYSGNFDYIVDIIKDIPSIQDMTIQYSFGSCTEWLYINVLENDCYTKTQKEVFKAEWIRKYPSLKYLETEEGLQLYERITRLKQSVTLTKSQLIEIQGARAKGAKNG